MTKLNEQGIITAEKPKLYDPNVYTVFGVFLGMVTVLFMSWSNSKHLPNAEQHKSTVKKYILIYLIALFAQFSVLGWATAESAKGVASDLATRSVSESYYAYMTDDYSSVSNSQYKFAKAVANNSSLVFFGINMVLLISFLIYTNKTEAEFFKESYKNKTIQGKMAILPLLIGIAYTALLYFASSPVVTYIAHLFINSWPN